MMSFEQAVNSLNKPDSSTDTNTDNDADDNSTPRYRYTIVKTTASVHINFVGTDQRYLTRDDDGVDVCVFEDDPSGDNEPVKELHIPTGLISHWRSELITSDKPDPEGNAADIGG
jgi:hypothetical protein